MYDIYALAKQLNRESFMVTNLFWVELQAGQVLNNFRTPEAGFLFVIRGEGTFVFDGTACRAVPGTVLHGGAGMKLDFEIDRRGELEYCLIHYTTVSESQALAPSPYQLNPGPQPAIMNLLRSLRDHAEIPGALPSLRTKILFYQLLHETLTCCELQSGQSKKDWFIKDALNYIQTNYMDSIQLRDVAARYGVSAGFFSSQFRRQIGVSPIEYLIQYRIRRAKEMLLTNQHSVREISHAVGYSDVYYFSRLFKQHAGVSPSRFRSSP